MARRLVFDLQEVERELDAETADILLDLATEITNELKKNSPVGATGDLQRSWQIFSQSPGRIVLGSPVHYADEVDQGAPPHTPDFDHLQTWARRKLGDQSAAGPVFQKIKQEGTEAQPFIDESIENAIQSIQ